MPTSTLARMNDDHPFRLILLAGLVLLLTIGIWHRLKARTGEKLDRRQEGLFILITLRLTGVIGWIGLLAYLINPQQVVAAPLFNLPGTGLLDVGLEFQTNHTLRLSTNVATLGFASFSNQSSAFVWLTLPDVAAQRLDGSVVTNAYGLSGRVVVVGEEPLLEALRAPGNQVLLLQYALPDSLIGLQWKTNVAGGGWEPSPPVTQTNLVQEAGRFTPTVPAMFFRALRGTSGP